MAGRRKSKKIRFPMIANNWVPLYEGKMVQAFDHRAADITQNVGNLFRPGQQETIPSSAKRDPDRFPVPRYYVKEDPERWRWSDHWVIAFKDITAATNRRNHDCGNRAAIRCGTYATAEFPGSQTVYLINCGFLLDRIGAVKGAKQTLDGEDRSRIMRRIRSC